MKNRKAKTLVEIRQDAEGNMFYESFGFTDDVNQLILDMMRRVADDQFGYFALNGFSARNTNTRIASKITHTGFIELLIMTYSEWISLYHSTTQPRKKFEIPFGFAKTAERYSEYELCQYYKVSHALILRWAKETRTTLIRYQKSGGSGRRSMEIPRDFAEMVNVMSKRDIANHYNVSPTTVYNWCHDLNIQVSAPRKTIPMPDDFSAFMRMPDYDTANAAEYYGVSHSTVIKWELQNGKYSKRIAARIPKDLADVVSKASTKHEIAQHYGVSNSSVSNWLAITGIRFETEIGKRKQIPADFTELSKFMTCEELAREYSVSITTALRWKKLTENED